MGESYRQVYVKNFCFVIETKTHQAEDIQLNGLTLLVKYNSKYKDVTTQSENQKYSLSNYFNDRVKITPYICNFIWFRNVSSESIENLLGSNTRIHAKHNYLPSKFNVSTLVQLACVQKFPYQTINHNDAEVGHPGFTSFNYNQEINLDKISEIFELFTKVKNGMGDLTRSKISRITKKYLGDQQYAQSIGEKLLIIAGRAGTGKTIRLLTIACDLALNNNARCLILTFNHALVSDIKRTLALADIPDGIDSYTVNISTLHKFFYEILIGFGIGEIKETKNGKKYILHFIEKYKILLTELTEYIENGLIDERDIQQLMHNRHEQVAWDYILY